MSGKAVDLANYSDVPTAVQVRCWLSQGYTKAIIGTSFGDVWQAQIAACSSAGMDVEEYVFPEHLPKLQPSGWWLDCEDDTANVDQIRSICAGVNPPIGIYTRRNFWLTETQNWNIVAEFPWLKLWDASYGDPPPAFVPYGGWTSRAIHQWHDSTRLCALNVDLNIIEEETVTQAEFDKLIAGSPLFVQMSNSLGAIARAFFDHVAKTGVATADAATLAHLQAEIDALTAAQKAAAAALAGK